MAEDVKPESLADFTGTEAEQRKQKTEFIKKYGYPEFEKLVVRSCDPKYKPAKK